MEFGWLKKEVLQKHWSTREEHLFTTLCSWERQKRAGFRGQWAKPPADPCSAAPAALMQSLFLNMYVLCLLQMAELWMRMGFPSSRWHPSWWDDSLWANIAAHKWQKMPSVLHGHIALHQIPHKTSRKPQIINSMKLTVCQTFHGIYPNCKWVSVRTLFREAKRQRKIYFWCVQHICLPISPSENFCCSLSRSGLSSSPFTSHLPALSIK